MLHGGDLTGAMARFGGGQADWLDLSTGINPHAYPLPKIAPRFWQTLPTQGDLDTLLKTARAAYRVPDKASLVAAPGTQALIQWMARLAPGGGTAVLGPTYNEHARAFRDAGHAITEIHDLSDWHGETNLIVVNPNNPDGRLLSQTALADLATEASRRGGWLVVDESFVDVMPDATAVDLCAEHPVVILRSFGKFYGLAGVRLGCVIASDHIASCFAVALGPWSVAGPALAIGDVALQDRDWADDMRARLMQEAGQLDAVLVNAGFEMIGGTVLYRLVRHLEATALHAHLAHHHIWIRKFDWDGGQLRFGLPGSEASLARLERALLAFAPHANPHGVITSSPSTV
jgi:cobalamin biosynthetic protein CobC